MKNLFLERETPQRRVSAGFGTIGSISRVLS